MQEGGRRGGVRREQRRQRRRVPCAKTCQGVDEPMKAHDSVHPSSPKSLCNHHMVFRKTA
eukprot:1123346-Pleurochrysis_carterae.AAC.2